MSCLSAKSLLFGMPINGVELSMKIYFGFTMRGDREKLDQTKEFVKMLAAKGHTILTNHVFDSDFEHRESVFSDEHIFNRDLAWLDEADIVIIEASGSSFGIGFEAAYALCSGKKVYLLYDKNLKNKVSKMATGNTMKKCAVFAYSSMKDIYDFIEENF